MSNSFASNTLNSSKQVARDIAKQVAKEPLEIIIDAKEQVVSPEAQQSKEDIWEPQSTQTVVNTDLEMKSKSDIAKSDRLMGALQKEIEDIRKQDLFKDIQAKIAQGVIIPIETFSELSIEQRQVLKAEQEAVKDRKAMQNKPSMESVPQISSKPGRRFGAGQKSEAERLERRVEKPLPPSG